VGEWVQGNILERLVTPDEVSDAVIWLSSSAAQMVTGVALPVDGGEIVRREESAGLAAETGGEQ
jgi:NAD(P)-dependent dehydrogenase (short-subunit alcohol dehydrogenase family)